MENNEKQYLNNLKKFMKSNKTMDFNQQTVNPENYTFMKLFNETINVHNAGGIIPFQAEGEIEGMFFYFRERNRYISLSVAKTKDSSLYSSENCLFYAEDIIPEEKYSNFIWVEYFLNLVEKLGKSEFPYEFEQNKSNGYTEIIVSHGTTPTEAYNKIMNIEFIRKHPFLKEKTEKEILDLHKNFTEGVQKTPINKDERVFPDVKFSLNVPKELRDNDGKISLAGLV